MRLDSAISRAVATAARASSSEPARRQQPRARRERVPVPAVLTGVAGDADRLHGRVVGRRASRRAGTRRPRRRRARRRAWRARPRPAPGRRSPARRAARARSRPAGSTRAAAGDATTSPGRAGRDPRRAARPPPAARGPPTASPRSTSTQPSVAITGALSPRQSRAGRAAGERLRTQVGVDRRAGVGGVREQRRGERRVARGGALALRDQQVGGLDRRAAPDHQPAAQLLGLGAQSRRPSPPRRAAPSRAPARPRRPRRGRRRAAGARPVRREPRGALERRRRRRERAPPGRGARHLLERGRRLLVGPDRRGGQMPGALLAAEHAGERAMRVAALAGAHRLVRGTADDRVRERRRAPASMRTSPRSSAAASRSTSTPAAASVTRSSPAYAAATTQRVARVRVELLDPARERRVQPPARRERRLERADPGALRGRQRRRQLDQRQRVAGRGLGERGGDVRREIGSRTREQLQRRVGLQRADRQLGEPERLRGVADREHERDVAARAARRVEDALARRGVDPLEVVDDREHRTAAPLAAARAWPRRPRAGRPAPAARARATRTAPPTAAQAAPAARTAPARAGRRAPRTRARPPSPRRAPAAP